MADWVSDSLVGFLQSPMWSYPVQSFIDHHCVVFDPGEENKFSYTDIHKEYQAMVENLMESFMADLGITSKQFLQVWSPNTKDREEHEHLFEQVLASEDFMLFKSMMVQRNIDLELQTLALLEKQLGHSPEAYSPSTDTKEPLRVSSEEDKIMEEVLRQSKQEFEENVLKEEEMLSLVKEESLQLYQAARGGREQPLEPTGKNVLKKKEMEEKMLSLVKEESLQLYQAAREERELTGKVDKVTLSDEEVSPKQPDVSVTSVSSNEATHSPAKTEATLSLEISQEKRKQDPLLPISGPVTPTSTTDRYKDGREELSGAEAAAMWLKSAQADVQHGSTGGTAAHSAHVPEDIKAREAYLRRQRDHLLEKKRKERAKQFDSFSASQSSQRPKSVQVAKSVAEGTMKEGSDNEATGKGRSTGVLCSAIAGRLKKELA